MKQPDSITDGRCRRLLVEGANSIMLCLDADGTISFANPRAGRFFGYAGRRLDGKPFAALFPKDEGSRRLVAGLLSSPKQYPAVTCENVKKGGEQVRIAWSFAAAGRGRVIAVGNALPADEVQGDSSQDLKLFKTLAENAPDVISRWDTSLRLVYVSPAIKVLLGLSPHDRVGKSVDELPDPELNRLWRQQLTTVLETGQRLSFEFDVKHVLDEVRHFHATLVPEKGEKGGIESVLSISRDITTLKHAEEVMRRDKETMEQLVDLNSRELMNAQIELQNIKRLSDIGTLAATIAHEVRNPLAAIRTAAYNIRRKAGSPLIESHLANIEKKIMESDQIIQNLLNYSRIKLPRFEKIELRALLRECITAVEHKYSRWQVQGRLTAETPGTVEADPVHLRILFMNILDNAWQSFPDKQGTVEVALQQEDKSFGITIRDNGQGIDHQDLTRIFDPFFTRKSCGIGLGLSICQQITELHHGTISVDSRQGEGTQFNITLPARQKAITVAQVQARLNQYG